MTQTIGGGIDALRAAMDGTVVVPEDMSYDEARKVWNADVDLRPAVIAHCASVQRRGRRGWLRPRPRVGDRGARWGAQHARLLACATTG